MPGEGPLDCENGDFKYLIFSKMSNVLVNVKSIYLSNITF